MPCYGTLLWIFAGGQRFSILLSAIPQVGLCQNHRVVRWCGPAAKCSTFLGASTPIKQVSEHLCFGQRKLLALVDPEKSLDKVTLSVFERGKCSLAFTVCFIRQLCTPNLTPFFNA